MAGERIVPPINRIPQGLLSFLGIKAGGAAPQAFSQSLLPNIDMLRWYADGNSSEGFANGAVVNATAAAGSIPITSAQWIAGGGTDFADGGASTTVPQNERWLLLEGFVGWNFNAAAGTISDWALAVQMGAGRTILPLSSLYGFTTSDAGVARFGARSIQNPFWMSPGSDLRLHQAGTTVGAGTVTPLLTVRILRMQQ